jgi:lipoprotein
MQKYKRLIVLMMTLLVFFIAGCNKAEEKSDNLKNRSSAAISATEASKSIQVKNESYTQDNPDIISDFTCSALTDDMAVKLGNEVKEIMTDGQEGAYKLDNFTIAFSNQTKKDKDIFIDITVMADWKTIRKPEDSPVIIGMNEAVKELKTKEEIDKANGIISGYIAEMNPYNKMERLPDYFKVRFIKGNTNKYELLFPERIGKTTLYPLKEYYNKNFKENREERMKLGRETLLRDLKAGKEN